MSPNRRVNKKIPFNATGQLENAVQLASKQDQIAWAIFGVFWPANALLLVALFTVGNPPPHVVGIIVSSVGFVLSVVWTVIQSRALGHLNFYEALIYRIESEYIDTPPDCYLSGSANKELFTEATVGTFRVRLLMKLIGVISAFLWLFTLFAFFCSKTT